MVGRIVYDERRGLLVPPGDSSCQRVRSSSDEKWIVLGFAAWSAVVAVPYMFMKFGSLKRDTFEIFLLADLFVLAGLGRAFFIYLKDRTGVGIG